jgi:glycosyltransferase involved in cell wall biosynthesis
MAALAHGRPLISTMPQIPTPELVHSENCWLVPVDNADALTQAVETLWADSELRAKLGNGATAVADLFTWDKIAIQTLDFFQEILNSSQ